MRKAIIVLLLLLALISSSLGVRTSVPELFIPDDSAQTASLTSTAAVESRLAGVKILQAVGTNRPAAKAVRINKALLASQTPQLQLTLPNTNRPITVTIRGDLSRARAPEDQAVSAARKASGAAGGRAGVQLNMWVGEVAGSPGPLSSVTFTTAASGAVYGNIRYYDRRAKKTRSLQVVPEIKRDHSPVSPAGHAFKNSSHITPKMAAALYPQLDTERYIVVEYMDVDLPRMFVTRHADGRTDVMSTTTHSSTPTTVDTTTEVPADPSANSTQAPADAFDTGGRKLLQSSPVQDVLVIFSAGAAMAAGGMEAMLVKAQENIARTNKAYQDSGINLQVSLLDARLIENWSEDGRDGDFLDDMAEGNVPNVRDWRDQLGADLVSMFHVNERSPYCGIAVMSLPDVHEVAAFSEVKIGCFDGYTFAHELGHNQGCSHNAEDTGGQTAYSYGWRRCDLGTRNFHTIMSYGCQDTDEPPAEVALFSTPTRTVNGVPAGDAAIGHCARRISETAAAVADFRSTVNEPPPPNNDVGEIKLGHLDKCLDAPSYNSGAQVIVYDCHGDDNQQWESDYSGVLRAYGAPDMCLDVAWDRRRRPRARNGQRVQISQCHEDSNQLWFRDLLNRLHPYFAPNFCLHMPSRTATNGAAFQLRSCVPNNRAQVFEAPHIPGALQPAGDGIKSYLNDLCLDVWGDDGGDGASLTMWSCHGEENQQWYAEADATLRSSSNSNLCLDATRNAKEADVVMWKCHGGDNQRWFLDAASRLRPYSDPSKCLDIRGARAEEGAELQLWDCLDGPQQQWYV